jgi:hypothetical protein
MSEWKAKAKSKRRRSRNVPHRQTRVTEIERWVDDLNAVLVRVHGAEQGVDAES